METAEVVGRRLVEHGPRLVEATAAGRDARGEDLPGRTEPLRQRARARERLLRSSLEAAHEHELAEAHRRRVGAARRRPSAGHGVHDPRLRLA